MPQRKMLSLWKIRSVSLAPIHYSGQKTHTEAALKRHVGRVDSVGGVLDVEEEQFIWEGHPSHKKDLSFYVCCALLSWLIVPILIAGWRYLETKHRVYLLTSERLRVSHGVLSKRMDELELYRVKDTSVEEPFWFRVFGLGNIIIETSDRSTPQVTLFAIPEARMLRESIRGAVEKRKDAKGVREVDFAQA